MWQALHFFRLHTSHAEVSINGSLERLYFPVLPVCEHLGADTMVKLMGEIDRSTPETKLEGLLQMIQHATEETAHLQYIQVSRLSTPCGNLSLIS